MPSDTILFILVKWHHRNEKLFSYFLVFFACSLILKMHSYWGVYMYIRNKMKFLPQKYETQLDDHWTFYQRRIPYLKVNPVVISFMYLGTVWKRKIWKESHNDLYMKLIRENRQSKLVQCCKVRRRKIFIQIKKKLFF